MLLTDEGCRGVGGPLRTPLGLAQWKRASSPGKAGTSGFLSVSDSDRSTIIVGDFNTPLTPMDKSTKQKINKETQTLNDTIEQLDLIDIYRTFHSKTMNFTFLSSAYGTFCRIDHILGHKSSLGKFKKTKVISSIFSDHNAVRLDINYGGKNY